MEAVLRRLPSPSSAPPGFLFHPIPLRDRPSQKVSEKGAAACRCSCLFSDSLSSWRRQQGQKKPQLWPDWRDGYGRRAGRVVVVAAKKKKKSGKSGTDGFLPNENEFFFPEAVLLKKKTTQEDGRVLPEFADAEEEKLFEFLNLQLENNLDMERMRHYEVVYLIHENYLNEVDSVTSKIQDFIREKRGKIWRLNNWGLRRLAYKIKKAKNANYILMNFELDAKFINDFKSLLDKEERIIRHLVIKRDEAITKDCPPPPEFHTLQAGGINEGVDEEHYDGEQGWNDEMESEMGGYNDDEDEFGDNIIFVDDKEDDNDVPQRDAKSSKVKQKVRTAS
ncbi:hypothetical protein Taro_047337 [Colocasia esculenta]|uniref:30S ribosomal protein S6 n=1 Tax=Colocasia esculenta TaxID=4460 RepID=A0A843X0T0_COLES|nr:hypothetical protein [Colocasia esculenta]